MVVAVERDVVEEMVGRVNGVEMWGAVNPLRGWEKKEEARELGPRAGEESGELVLWAGSDWVVIPSEESWKLGGYEMEFFVNHVT